MQLSIISIALALLSASHLALAAPATPAGVDVTTSEPLAERSLVARQIHSGRATEYRPSNGCGANEPEMYGWVSVNAKDWVYGDVPQASCRRHVTVYNQGKSCDGCKKGDLQLSGSLWSKFASGGGSIEVNWATLPLAKLAVIMQTWRRLLILLAMLFTVLQLALGENVPESSGGLLPEGDGTLDAPIDFTSAEDVMEKLGPVMMNPDGSMSRIANWKELTKRERATYLKKLAKDKTTRIMKSKNEM
ncbi:unnamed protein product [Rhizoctonia solani]|uniref:Uncharacterized protein n=1 Tax=Rhizoctonia solani TaxID=456999 RepID=A0A8H3DJJ3_9AGAM|nr:unnamed protein product [Rhizoctonia solani]